MWYRAGALRMLGRVSGLSLLDTITRRTPHHVPRQLTSPCLLTDATFYCDRVNQGLPSLGTICIEYLSARRRCFGCTDGREPRRWYVFI